LLSSIHIRATAADLFNDWTIDHQASQAAFGDWLRKRDLPAYQQSGRGARAALHAGSGKQQRTRPVV
jgi:hypothetical protein